MICWARYLFIGIVAVLGIGQMMAACGQKGDLYLPPPEPESKEQEKTAEYASDVPRAQDSATPPTPTDPKSRQ